MTKSDELANAALNRLVQIIKTGSNDEALQAISIYASIVEITQGVIDANG